MSLENMPEPVDEEHEFGVAESQVFGNAASAIRFAGLMGMIFGGLTIGLGVIQLLGNGGTLSSIFTIVGGVLQFLIWGWFRQGGSALRDVALTEGSDVGHLMTAMQRIRKACTWQGWLQLIALIIIGVSILVLLMALASSKG